MPDQPLESAAADLLSERRLAERNVAAPDAVRVIAESALEAAVGAEDAAEAAEAAAEAVREAALRARAAAVRARTAARHAAEETQTESVTAHGARSQADEAGQLEKHADIQTQTPSPHRRNDDVQTGRWAPSTSPSEWTDGEP